MELSCLINFYWKFKSKKNGKDYIGFQYIPTEKDCMETSDIAKGYKGLTLFVDYTDEKFMLLNSKDFLMQPVKVVFGEKRNPRNPFKTELILNSIQCKNENICLL